MDGRVHRILITSDDDDVKVRESISEALAMIKPPKQLWLDLRDTPVSGKWRVYNAPNPFAEVAYVRQDIVDERVRVARREVWDAAIVEVVRLPAFDDQNLLKQTFEYERDREARAAEGEG